MALGITFKSSGIDTDSGTQELSVATTTAFTPTANRVLIAVFMVENTTGSGGTYSMTGNGLTWNKFAENNWFTGHYNVAFWALTGGSPSNGTQTCTWTTDPGNNYALVVYECDADQTAPIVQMAAGESHPTSNPNFTFASPTIAGNGVIGMVKRFNNSTNFVEPVGWTEDFESNLGGGVGRGAQTCHHDDPGSVTLVTWNATNADPVAWGIEIEPAGAAVTPPGLPAYNVVLT
jgi:hypothetical protein